MALMTDVVIVSELNNCRKNCLNIYIFISKDSKENDLDQGKRVVHAGHLPRKEDVARKTNTSVEVNLVKRKENEGEHVLVTGKLQTFIHLNSHANHSSYFNRDRSERKRDKRDRSRSRDKDRERKRDKERKERKPEFDIKIKEEPIDGKLSSKTPQNMQKRLSTPQSEFEIILSSWDWKVKLCYSISFRTTRATCSQALAGGFI